MDNNNRKSYILRIVAGAYVGYLGIKIIADYFKGNSDGMNAGIMICAIAFVVIAAVLLITTLRSMKRDSDEERRRDDERAAIDEANYGEAVPLEEGSEEPEEEESSSEAPEAEEAEEAEEMKAEETSGDEEPSETSAK